MQRVKLKYLRSGG